jgi:hypothetical protein
MRQLEHRLQFRVSLEADATAAEQRRAPGWAGAALGLLSALLLAASFLWAHDWGLVADTIVGAWAAATTAALVVSIWSLRTSRATPRFAKSGIALAGVSLVALTFAAILFAAGGDPSGACGGG